MKQLFIAFVAVLVGAGCRSDTPQSGEVRSAITEASITLTRSNTAEFDGQVAIPVRQLLNADGDTEVHIGPVGSWPILNGFLGFDKFYYNESWIEHPVIGVQDELCDNAGNCAACSEPVVGGYACGWHVNYDGYTGDGFGQFESRTSAEGASNGGRTRELVFVLRGNADVVPNDHGSRFALHGRFDNYNGYSPGCSGWFSDGTPGESISDSGCLYAANCRMVVTPTSASIFAGEAQVFDVQTYVNGIHQLELALSVAPSPFYPNMSALLVPNPVIAPTESILRVATNEFVSAGVYPITLKAEGVAYGLPVTCEAEVSLDVKRRPPPPPNGYCTCE